ncbi:alpha/beta fold hydrolase [Sulfitobacter sp. S190]|uniref:alpha/beta fold hydrolase n=1 Tax=Sulfitobacter sp. S190 TaxID=2867022 RepID=UPI0021A3D18A|nr:alpha/beta hydrolase [Sulfitobacter sp. S190]UWR20956.1 alpha/beta hydrolase [Sulfitobacter sp. S190]
MTHIPGFEFHETPVDGHVVAYARGGSGVPVLLLHGFPQTHAMWHAIAPQLAQKFTVIAPDLRGYGASAKPEGTENYSFRNMAAGPLGLMRQLGFDRFHLVGHDRGARTAHRMALDAPDAPLSLCLMDIVPTHLLLDDLSRQVAQAYYHWFFLAQPHPLPETMIGHDPDAFFNSCLMGWGATQTDSFDSKALAAYRAAWRDPDTIRGMCADYRAALRYDFDQDAADLGRKIDQPSLVLYGAEGVMGLAYDVGATWADRLSNMQVKALPGGHFFPDQYPDETARALLDFLV